MTQVHVGLDVGGTASRWVACDAHGEVVARGSVGGATAHVFNPSERARLAGILGQIAEALGGAGVTAASLNAGLTGFGAAAGGDIRALASRALGLAPEAILVVDDIVLAYASHFKPGEGHLVSAGTGSIGIHVGVDGAMVRVGGRGILIDDAGSGSWIALRALDQVYRNLDRNGTFAEVEALADALFSLVGGAEWHDVRQYVYAGDRGKIGALAVAVGQAAAAGDNAALSILRDAGAELAGLALALQHRAGIRPVAIIGGVLQLHPVIGAEIDRRLAGTIVVRPVIDGALAAARLGVSEAGQAWWGLLG